MNEWANDKEIYWCIVGNIYGLIVVKFYALHTQGHHHKMEAGEHLSCIWSSARSLTSDNAEIIRVWWLVSSRANTPPVSQGHSVGCNYPEGRWAEEILETEARVYLVFVFKWSGL